MVDDEPNRYVVDRAIRKLRDATIHEARDGEEAMLLASRAWTRS